ncbi:MAG: D-2-hydroxyacid dehydrogenase family protein [Acetobacteraceae bacterium]
MIRVAILDDWQGVALGLADWASLGPDVEVVPFREPLRADRAAEALAGFDAICLIRERMAVPRALIEALPRLRLIVVTGREHRTLDRAAAEERGIAVLHTPSGESLYATTELALGLLLACARNIPREDSAIRDGRWQETIGTLLHGKTLGLVGLGRLGARMAVLGQALGMRVIAWSPNLTPERAAGTGAEAVSRAALFAESDAVSIHLVLSDATRGLIGADDLARMKRGAILVNTARGPIVQEAALLAALRDGPLGAAGLDVFEQEPLPPPHPLRTLPNVVLTPHLGYVTDVGYRIYFEGMVGCLRMWLGRGA